MNRQSGGELSVVEREGGDPDSTEHGAWAVSRYIHEIAQELCSSIRDAGRCVSELSAANERLLELALRDGLTNLYNHVHIKQVLGNEIMRAERSSAMVSVLMADIDDFKQINDTCGHLVGDKVLSLVSGLIVQNIRSFDIPARYGGEEFMIILPDTGPAEAWHVAERIRNAIAARSSAELGLTRDLKLTLSIGLASCPPDGSAATALISRADALLYHAKNTGKNQVCSTGIL